MHSAVQVEPFALRAPARTELHSRLPRQLCARMLAGGGLLFILLICTQDLTRLSAEPVEQLAIPVGSQVGLFLSLPWLNFPLAQGTLAIHARCCCF